MTIKTIRRIKTIGHIRDEHAVSSIFGILLMVAVIIIFAAFISIYLLDLGNDKLEKSGYSKGVTTDTVYRIQYDQDYVSILLTHYNNDSIIYRVSNRERVLIKRLENSYNNQIPVEIYYTRIGWLYQISNVE